jgi:hypothetical protein
MIILYCLVSTIRGYLSNHVQVMEAGKLRNLLRINFCNTETSTDLANTEKQIYHNLVMILTVKAVVDLGSELCWTKPTVPS